MVYGKHNENVGEGGEEEEFKRLLNSNIEEEQDSSLQSGGDNHNDISNRTKILRKRKEDDNGDGTLENGIESEKEKSKTFDELLPTRPYCSLVLMIRLMSSSLDRRDLALAVSWLIITLILFSTQSEGSNNISGSTNSNIVTYNYTRPNTIVGYIHIAKTAGTEINGQLANHFERICGNKGYSYDAYQHNLRAHGEVEQVNDSYHEKYGKTRRYRGMNRGSVWPWMMAEIGFEDCDWIGVEDDWKVWLQFENWAIPMELHVPCRSPILDHLMSQCNYQKYDFDCHADDLMEEINKCHVGVRERFNMTLANIFPTKCFYPMIVQNYIRYMSTKLQKKRIESQYIHRESNRPRNKTAECIWSMDSDFQEKVKDILMRSFDYYKFCDKCMGSKNELILS